MTVTAFTGDVPTTADPDNFDANADALLAWLGGDLVTEINATAAEINADETSTAANAAIASAAATAASASATAAAAAATTNATSTDTETLASSGSVTFTTQSGKSFVAGQYVRAASAADPNTHWMSGFVDSYASTSLVVIMDDKGSGTGDRSDWVISLAPRGGMSAAVAASLWTASPSAVLAVTPDALLDAITPGTFTYNAAMTWDVATKGFTLNVTLTGNVTSVAAPSILIDGQVYTINALQDGTGGRTVTGFNAVYDLGSYSASDHVTTASTLTQWSGMYLALTGKIHLNHRPAA